MINFNKLCKHCFLTCHSGWIDWLMDCLTKSKDIRWKPDSLLLWNGTERTNSRMCGRIVFLIHTVFQSNRDKQSQGQLKISLRRLSSAVSKCSYSDINALVVCAYDYCVFALINGTGSLSAFQTILMTTPTVSRGKPMNRNIAVICTAIIIKTIERCLTGKTFIIGKWSVWVARLARRCSRVGGGFRLCVFARVWRQFHGRAKNGISKSTFNSNLILNSPFFIIIGSHIFCLVDNLMLCRNQNTMKA